MRKRKTEKKDYTDKLTDNHHIAINSEIQKKQTPKNLLFTGAEDEIRTRDPRLGKAMLYH